MFFGRILLTGDIKPNPFKEFMVTVAETEQEAENLAFFEQFHNTVFHNGCHFLISHFY
jgi:hypothetical protein